MSMVNTKQNQTSDIPYKTLTKFYIGKEPNLTTEEMRDIFKKVLSNYTYGHVTGFTQLYSKGMYDGVEEDSVVFEVVADPNKVNMWVIARGMCAKLEELFNQEEVMSITMRVNHPHDFPGISTEMVQDITYKAVMNTFDEENEEVRKTIIEMDL